MASSVSVIIPALNEAAHIGAAIDSAFAAGAAEVLVSDGGSTDATRDVAVAHGALLVTGERMRARQCNRAAERATGECLLFLHADTQLPAGACDAVVHALASGYDLGGFRLRFAEDIWTLRLAAAMINLRTRLTRQPWGDQAQFLRRADFLHSGGFREIPILEDYELASRMRRRVVLPMSVTTSGRRFLAKGVVRTAIINWTIVVRWKLGADAERLAQLYRKAKVGRMKDEG